MTILSSCVKIEVMNSKITQKINEFKQLHPDKDIVAVFQTGSHLFKLNSEKSDLDITGIYLPSKKEVLSKTYSKEINLGTNQKNIANTKDDVDCKFISLKRYIELLMTGEFNSLELLYAPDYAIIQSSDQWKEIQYLRDNFVVFNISSFLGFIKQEYKKAGFTGNIVEEIKTVLNLIESLSENDELVKHHDQLMKLDFIKVKNTKIDNSGQKKLIASYFIANRLFQNTIKIRYLKNELKKIINTTNVSMRKDEKGIDLKGMYHSQRLLFEAESLILSKTITIPFPDDQYKTLKDIRGGVYCLNDLKESIESQIKKIQSLEKNIINTHYNLPFMEKYWDLK